MAKRPTEVSYVWLPEIGRGFYGPPIAGPSAAASVSMSLSSRVLSKSYCWMKVVCGISPIFAAQLQAHAQTEKESTVKTAVRFMTPHVCQTCQHPIGKFCSQSSTLHSAVCCQKSNVATFFWICVRKTWNHCRTSRWSPTLPVVKHGGTAGIQIQAGAVLNLARRVVFIVGRFLGRVAQIITIKPYLGYCSKCSLTHEKVRTIDFTCAPGHPGRQIHARKERARDSAGMAQDVQYS